MSQTKEFEVAIIGGGIAGITLAAALSRRSVPVKIYEQAPAFGEIGAGVSFSPNAVQAMKVCHEGIYKAFQNVCTKNVWPSKQKVWFDYLDGHGESEGDGHAFTISNNLGQNGVHRAHFLSEMVGLVPESITKFGKRLNKISELESGRMLMEFDDGTSAEADAVIGCDGIKSRVRQSMFGADRANPSYTHKYAYRGLVPMEEAIKAVGEERAQNACMYMGPGGHVLTFPVNHGKILNIVAFKTDPEDWPDVLRLTRKAERKDLLHDFGHYNKTVVNLLSLTNPTLDVWAIFDLLADPPPTYTQGRVCITGDAAHASSPHHGAGAGLCIEDSAVLAELLADERVTSRDALEAVFSTFDSQRRERGRFLVETSRFIGECYEWQADGVGTDFKRIEEEINKRNGMIANIDVVKMCEEARYELGERLGATSKI